ncbi:two-component system OmpR family response regulator/two-component system phosphate regulon response regulator OmpR [Rhodobacter sp. JA431]|nr:two-component system OmpR family response regulator/two-component system phosphate regulon response regulator OmpR [Rhodobacter sp. JA431]
MRMSMTRKPAVLVVDDDPELRALLCDYLHENGLAPTPAADGAALWRALGALPEPPAALVLDLMLPGEDGLSLLRRLRAQTDLPVLMLSARGDEMDRIIGLEVGADDYMAKPFNPRELLARLRALMRRRAPAAPESAVQFTFGPFRLDCGARVLWRDGEEITLTTAEYDLLEAFLAHPRRGLSRDQLIELIRGGARDPFDRSIDNRVTRLRRKIEEDPTHPRFIRTLRGAGYLFDPEPGSGGPSAP